MKSKEQILNKIKDFEDKKIEYKNLFKQENDHKYIDYINICNDYIHTLNWVLE